MKQLLNSVRQLLVRKSKKNVPLRRETYDRKYKQSLRDWLIFHQKDIVFKAPHWMGIPIWKNPLDAWIYQEILYEVQPEIVVEIGSRFGGSTKFFADLLSILGQGQVISIDKYRKDYNLVHEKVTALDGDSSSPEILSKVDALCAGKSTLVIQDGDHSCKQVLEDLNNYSKFVTAGSYFIVEDGIVDLFHPGDGLGFSDPGPLAATEKFLSENPQFIADETRERYVLTYNPTGFLKRIR